MVVLACGYFITHYVHSDSAFPDFFTVVCKCIDNEDDCNRIKYGCKWQLPDNLQNYEVQSASCVDKDASSLKDLGIKDGAYLLAVAIGTLLCAPLQYFFTQYSFGGSEELIEELQEEIDTEGGELLRMRHEIKAMSPSREKSKRIKEYNALKKAYEDKYHTTKHLEERHNMNAHHRLSLDGIAEERAKQQASNLHKGPQGPHAVAVPMETMEDAEQAMQGFGTSKKKKKKGSNAPQSVATQAEEEEAERALAGFGGHSAAV